MNRDDNINEQINTPSQNAQGHWYDLLSPTQVLTEEQKLDDNKKQEQKKKKCRGNRKAQRLRRRERRHQQIMNNHDTNDIDEDIITMDDDSDDPIEEDLEQIREHSLNNHPEIRSENKRKRHDLNKDDINVNRSFSQLSISQAFQKKKKTTTVETTNQSNNQILKVVNGYNHEENDETLPMNYIQRFKPHYLKVSDKIFKQILSNTITDGDKIVQCLDTTEKVQFVREITEVTNNLQYLNLQHDLWQDYYNLGMKEGIWGPRLSKSYAKRHNTCRTYGFPKHIIEKRQQTIKYQLQRTTNELQQYEIKLEQNAQQWQPSFDPNVLSNAINECVKKSQQRLRQEFDYKKKMLELDSNDHHSITKFYNLQPNVEQIHLAKLIWQTTADELKTKEYIDILRKRIFLQRLPSAIDKIINRSVDPIQLLLSNPAVNKDRRASLVSSCSKTITQYKFDLMSLNLDIIETIKRGHQQSLLDLQDKLRQSDCNETFKSAIENRQKAMQERHEAYLNHKLNTFFDEAPTASNE